MACLDSPHIIQEETKYDICLNITLRSTCTLLGLVGVISGVVGHIFIDIDQVISKGLIVSGSIITTASLMALCSYVKNINERRSLYYSFV